MKLSEEEKKLILAMRPTGPSRFEDLVERTGLDPEALCTAIDRLIDRGDIADKTPDQPG